MSSTFVWSSTLIFCLLFLQAIANRYMGFGQTLLFGIVIGIGFGSALGAMAATAAHSWDRRRDRQQIDRMLHEHLQPEIIYEADPLAIEALGRLTDKAVLGGFCCYCGSDDKGLTGNPFAPKFHIANPMCPVPLSRKIYEDTYIKCGQKIRKPHAVLTSKQTARIASSKQVNK